MDITLMTISSWVLLVFIALSFFDGVYYHIWKFRLQERTDSQFEHITHTVRAVLFVPTLFLIYGMGVQGTLVWGLFAVLTLDLIAEIFDVLNEKSSRSKIGGLPSTEYLAHIFLTSLRVTALALAFAALPKTAWQTGSSTHLVLPEISKLVVDLTLPGAIIIAFLHIYLIFDAHFISRTEKLIRSYCCANKVN